VNKVLDTFHLNDAIKKMTLATEMD
jgi:hypothetical protein